MPIETKPEQKTLTGDEARRAVADGVQRALNRRIDEKALKITVSQIDDGQSMSSSPVNDITITCDVVGPLKGPKVGTKRAARKPKPATAA